MELRDAGCRDCQRTTIGDCGKHGPSISFIPQFEYTSLPVVIRKPCGCWILPCNAHPGGEMV